MFKFLYKKLKNETGSMDTIIVTLLLVLVGIGAIAGFAGWMETQTDALKNDANITLHNIMNE
ncbi:MAG: hypothetical protein U9P38_06220 [Campylobacterota bacterium]|nr:hypothetical protein [Campylobacterota bacterium]